MSSWGKVWSVSSSGETEWEFRVPDEDNSSEIRINVGSRFRAPAALTALGLSPGASEDEIRQAYRAAAKASHPDLHPDDEGAAFRFREIQEAYEDLAGDEALVARIRFSVGGGFATSASFLLAHEDDWLVGVDGKVFRLNAQGEIVTRVRLARSAQTAPILDARGRLAGLAAQGTLWFIDAAAPVDLPAEYQWTGYIRGSFGQYLLAHRSGDSHLALIDEWGVIALRVETPRAITSVCVGENTLVVIAGTLICFHVDGLSATREPRTWRLPTTP